MAHKQSGSTKRPGTSSTANPRTEAEQTERSTVNQDEEAGTQTRAQGVEMKQQMHDLAHGLSDRARQEAHSALDRVTEEVRATAGSYKQVAAGQVGSVAQALRQAANSLNEQNQSGVAQYIERAAEGVERFAQSLDERDLADLATQMRDIVQRQPALFIGGAVTLGFFAARFIKSSSQRDYSSDLDYSSDVTQEDTRYTSPEMDEYAPEYPVPASSGTTPGTSAYSTSSARDISAEPIAVSETPDLTAASTEPPLKAGTSTTGSTSGVGSTTDVTERNIQDLETDRKEEDKPWQSNNR